MKKVLVADDDNMMSQMVCGLVRQQGWQAIPAFDAMQTFMLAMREPRPDLVVLDINMPGGTGLEALRRLKASSKTATIPVLVLSGSEDPTVPDAVRALGAEDFLPKPADPGVLVATLARLLGAAPR